LADFVKFVPFADDNDEEEEWSRLCGFIRALAARLEGIGAVAWTIVGGETRSAFGGCGKSSSWPAPSLA
jgi:hypothetical protein